MGKQHTPAPPPVEMHSWARVLRYEDAPVLSLSLSWPSLPGTCPGFRRINRCCRHLAQVWQQRWEGPVYRDACAAAAAAAQAGRPFQCWEGRLGCTITLCTGELLSLYSDAWEYTGGAHGSTVRWADTWQIPSGAPRTLASFFPPRSRWRGRVLSALADQARARMAGGETCYYDDWPARLKSAFDPDHFYLTESGLSIFYPLYAIGPYIEGIPVFSLPLPEGAPVRDAGPSHPSPGPG